MANVRSCWKSVGLEIGMWGRGSSIPRAGSLYQARASGCMRWSVS